MFSALGELLWYLAGSNDTEHIAHYIPMYAEFNEGGVVFGGYGPRLRGPNDQLATVIHLLHERPATRRAVIQLFDSKDLLDAHKDVPCTCTLQFLRRERGVDLIVYMRSNDVFMGLPHDVFCFTMIQEIVARAINAELGYYVHVAGSLHLYEDKVEAAHAFLQEGWFSTSEMPPMPAGDPMANVGELIVAEARLRAGEDPLSVTLPSNPYWGDLARLLVAFELRATPRADEIAAMMSQMSTRVFDLHIEDRLGRRQPPA